MTEVPALLCEAWDNIMFESLLVTESPLDRNVSSEFNVIFQGLICNELRSVYFLESLTNTEVDISGFMYTYIVLILWKSTLHNSVPVAEILILTCLTLTFPQQFLRDYLLPPFILSMLHTFCQYASL